MIKRKNLSSNNQIAMCNKGMKLCLASSSIGGVSKRTFWVYEIIDE
jgi:hypothetical protein